MNAYPSQTMKQDETDKTAAIAALIQITNRRIGYTPSTPTEFDNVIMMIRKKTGTKLSLSTVKRLWGYISYEGAFSESTLNILARYNNLPDWETFRRNYGRELAVTNDADSGFLPETIIDPGQYNPGDRFELVWHDGKGCELECIGKLRFRVMNASNIKLRTGDLVTLHTLCIGHPVFISDITRGDYHYTSYVGAKKGGLLRIHDLS